MSILKNSVRPSQYFEPSNIEHRKAYIKFLHDNSWSKLPYTFTLEAEYSDVISMVNDKLLKYYLNNDNEL